MPASYSSTPISGFTGHIPGAKWQVGSRYIPPARTQPPQKAFPTSHTELSLVPNGDVVRENSAEHSERFRDHENEADEHRSAAGREDMQSESGHRSVQFSPDASHHGFAERSERGPNMTYPEDARRHITSQEVLQQLHSQLSLFRPGSSEMSIIYNSDGFPIRIIKNNQALSSPSSEHLRNGFPLERSPQPTTRPASVKHRARSLPRRNAEKDPFEGLEGGWWSKGEVQRNKERRDLANSGKNIAGGNYSQRPETPKRQPRWKERDVDIDDIPAAGYSGHLPGFRQIGVGKSFNTAAREAKRDYAIRRRALSGDRLKAACRMEQYLQVKQHKPVAFNFQLLISRQKPRGFLLKIEVCSSLEPYDVIYKLYTNHLKTDISRIFLATRTSCSPYASGSCSSHIQLQEAVLRKR